MGSNDDSILTVVPREGVLALDTEAVLQGLSVLVLSRSLAPQAQGHWRLFFGGYDDDPRELWQIPEVRQFVRRLDAVFPYWFFLADLESETLLVIAKCICFTAAAGPGHGTVNKADLRAFAERQFDGMNQLWELHSLPEERLCEVSEAIARFFEARQILN